MLQTTWKRFLGVAAAIFVAVWGADGAAEAGTFTGLGPTDGTLFTSITFHPTDPNTVYFGMDDGGELFKSIDGGLSVQYVSGNVPDVSAWTVAINPANTLSVWAGDFYGRGVYRSLDGGTTWALYNRGFPATPPYYARTIDALAFDPSTTGRLLAYTHDGLYTLDTTVVNSSWVKRAKPPDVPVLAPDGTPDLGDTVRMVVDGSGRLFVGGALGKLYMAQSATQSWTLQAAFPSEDISDLAIDPVTGALFVTTFAGGGVNVRRSTDLGVSWTPVLVNEPSLALGKFAVHGNAMYLATFGLGTAGVRRSLNGGATWETIGSGVDKPFGITLAINPLNTSQVFLGGFTDAYRTSNATAPAANVIWTKSNYGLKYTSVQYTLVDPANTNHVFTTDVGLFDLPGLRAVFESTNAGATWNPMPGYIWSAWSLTMAPGNPQVLLAGTWTQGVKRSTDGGVTWSATGLPFGLILKIAFGSSPQIAFAVSSDSGVFKSTDGGVTWAQRLALPVCYDLLVDPINPNIVYAAGAFGAWASLNAGETWSPLGPTSTIGTALAVDPQDSRLYLGTVSSGLYATSGNGWARVDPPWQGLIASVVAASPSTIYVGVNTLNHLALYFQSPTPGYFRSNDAAVSWVNLSSGQRPVTAVTFATGVPGSAKQSYLVLNGEQRYSSGDLFNYSPSGTRILQGTFNSGSNTSLVTNDNIFYIVNSTTSSPYITDWYGSITLSQAPSSVATLALTYNGKYSINGVTQRLYLYNWSSASWTQIDARTVGTVRVMITNLQTSPASFISTTGQILFRIQGSSGSSPFTSNGDYMLFTVETAPSMFKMGASSEVESMSAELSLYQGVLPSYQAGAIDYIDI